MTLPTPKKHYQLALLVSSFQFKVIPCVRIGKAKTVMKSFLYFMGFKFCLNDRKAVLMVAQLAINMDIYDFNFL